MRLGGAVLALVVLVATAGCLDGVGSERSLAGHNTVATGPVEPESGGASLAVPILLPLENATRAAVFSGTFAHTDGVLAYGAGEDEDGDPSTQVYDISDMVPFGGNTRLRITLEHNIEEGLGQQDAELAFHVQQGEVPDRPQAENQLDTLFVNRVDAPVEVVVTLGGIEADQPDITYELRVEAEVGASELPAGVPLTMQISRDVARLDVSSRGKSHPTSVSLWKDASTRLVVATGTAPGAPLSLSGPWPNGGSVILIVHGPPEGVTISAIGAAQPLPAQPVPASYIREDTHVAGADGLLEWDVTRATGLVQTGVTVGWHHGEQGVHTDEEAFEASIRVDGPLGPVLNLPNAQAMFYNLCIGCDGPSFETYASRVGDEGLVPGSYHVTLDLGGPGHEAYSWALRWEVP